MLKVPNNKSQLILLAFLRSEEQKVSVRVLVTLKWHLLDKLPPSHSLSLLACASAGGGLGLRCRSASPMRALKRTTEPAAFWSRGTLWVRSGTVWVRRPPHPTFYNTYLAHLPWFGVHTWWWYGLGAR